jgi:transcription-repair coupling factor (superfamily II helicase)
MNLNFDILRKIKEKVTINNASKDYFEFLIFNIIKNINKNIVWINDDINSSRVIKNFKFLDPELDLIAIEEKEENYNFTSVNLEESGKKIFEINKLLNSVEKQRIIILNSSLLLKKLPPKEFFEQKINLQIGQNIEYSSLINSLFNFGFNRRETSYEFGDFSVRGFIIDIGLLEGFFRLEFDGAILSSISKFNTETQRKEGKYSSNKLEITPIKEVVINKEKLKTCANRLYEFSLDWGGNFLNEIEGFYSLSLHNFTPLFFNQTSNILNFLPKDCLFISSSSLPIKLEQTFKNATILYDLYTKNQKLLLPPPLLMNNPETITRQIEPIIFFKFYYEN